MGKGVALMANGEFQGEAPSVPRRVFTVFGFAGLPSGGPAWSRRPGAAGLGL